MTNEQQQPDHVPASPERLIIGRVVAPHGVRGEFRMFIYTHFPERIPDLPEVYLGDESSPRKLRRARIQGNVAIMRIAGIDDRDMAEALRQTTVSIDREYAAPLEDDEFYHYQILNLQALDEAGNLLGEVVEIIETGANDVYVIRPEEGNYLLIPALKSVVLSIEPEAGRMIVRPPEYFER
jgi:16S rRNA processing protein RimM